MAALGLRPRGKWSADEWPGRASHNRSKECLSDLPFPIWPARPGHLPRQRGHLSETICRQSRPDPDRLPEPFADRVGRSLCVPGLSPPSIFRYHPATHRKTRPERVARPPKAQPARKRSGKRTAASHGGLWRVVAGALAHNRPTEGERRGRREHCLQRLRPGARSLRLQGQRGGKSSSPEACCLFLRPGFRGYP